MICQRVHHDATGLCRHHRVRLDKLSCPSLGAQSAKSTAQSHPALQNGLWHRCHVCRAGNSDWIQVGIVARKPGQKSVCQRTLAQLCFLKVCHGLPVSSNQVRVRRPRVHQSITLMIFGTMTPPWINGWELRIFIGIYRNTDSEAMIASLTNQCRLLATAASRICFKNYFPSILRKGNDSATICARCDVQCRFHRNFSAWYVDLSHLFGHAPISRYSRCNVAVSVLSP